MSAIWNSNSKSEIGAQAADDHVGFPARDVVDQQAVERVHLDVLAILEDRPRDLAPAPAS